MAAWQSPVRHSVHGGFSYRGDNLKIWTLTITPHAVIRTARILFGAWRADCLRRGDESGKPLCSLNANTRQILYACLLVPFSPHLRQSNKHQAQPAKRALKGLSLLTIRSIIQSSKPRRKYNSQPFPRQVYTVAQARMPPPLDKVGEKKMQPTQRLPLKMKQQDAAP